MKRHAIRRIPVKKNSILLKILIPMLLVMTLQSIVFVGAIYWGGTVKSLNANAFALMNERVINRKNYLENDMVSRWSNVKEPISKIDSMLYTEGFTAASLMDSTVFATEMINFLRRSMATGVFVVMDDTFTRNVGQSDEQELHYGFYIRDDDPMSTPGNHSDLQLEIASSAMKAAMEDVSASYWDVGFSAEQLSDCYRKPHQAAQTYPHAATSDLGYWSMPFRFTSRDREVITYTVPLVHGGKPYGVLGVELTASYFKKSLPYSEIDANGGGAYAVAVRREEGVFRCVVSSGPYYSLLMEGETEIELGSAEQYNENSYRIVNGRQGEKAYGCVQYLKLYNDNTPFENERWAIIGIQPSKNLFQFSSNVVKTMAISVAVSIALGLAFIVLASVLLTRPVMKLVDKLRNDPSPETKLEHVNIYEIDELTAAIQELNDRVSRSSARLSKIIDAAQIPLGAFEYNQTSRKVYTTNKFYGIVGAPQPEPGKETEHFVNVMKRIEQCLEDATGEDESVRVYRLEEDGAPKWVKMRIVENGRLILGVVQDITQETLEKRKIEHERDYDLLTNLLNRRAFLARLTKLFAEPAELGVAALILMDLDNLKHINDTYGHDSGDDYLCLAASTLQQCAPERSVVARMAGDEFYVFLYGFPSRSEGAGAVDRIVDGLKNSSMRLPDGSNIRMRATGGVAWYPDDTTSLEDLLQYADFAMYEVKHRVKGEFKDFDSEHYDQNSYLLYNKEDLNTLLEKELVEYYFQPIVEVATGSVYGYEALMRSQVPSLKSPTEIMELARSQFKLHLVERLTWFKAMQAYVENADAFGKRRIFINTVSSQRMPEEDVKEFERRFAPYLSRIVMEFTEGEKQDIPYTREKQGYIEHWGGLVALDDFGAGYNGENFLLSLQPDFLKIDMELVRSVDRDESKRVLMESIVSYAHSQKIRIIAEGVETRDELKTVIACGVDYVQGFYTGVPSPKPQALSRALKRDIVALYNAGRRGESK